MNQSPEQQPILSLRDLRTWFPIRKGVLARQVGQIKAVDGVSLDVAAGETLGLVGESGCGKTTLGRTILGLETATGGDVLFKGRSITGLSERRLRAIRQQIQMIFQDPFSSLNPRMTVMDIITEGLAQHGLLQEPRDAAAARLMGEVGLDRGSMYRYPHEFSGGQRQRISVARALSLNPDFIVCDEAVSALDVSVQAQVINLLMDLRQRYSLSYLFISHDLSVVKFIAQRVAVMYLGRIVETGPSRSVMEQPLHPYTQALVSAIPTPGKDKRKRLVLQGDLPSPANPPSGCSFHTRCPRAMPVCRSQWPEQRRAEGHVVSCHLYSNGDSPTPPDDSHQ